MKVLYLAPSAPRPDRLTAHSFIDEEIHAFAEAGITAHLLSSTATAHGDIGRVRVHAMPPSSLSARASSLAFLLAQRRTLPRRLLTHLRKTGYFARIERAAVDVVRREGIDLIHSHFGWPGGLGGVLAREKISVPLVASLRGMDLLLRPEIAYGVRADPDNDASIRHLLRNADRTLYASDFMRGEGISLGAEPATALTIRKGVELAGFTPSPDREALRTSLGVDGPMLLTVCQLIRRKGVDQILEALAPLRDRFGFTLVVCGEGKERQALEAQAGRLGLADRVRFTGQVSRADVTRYFAACDAFVLASITEAAGNVVLEAMASARPVITTASGGPPEYVDEGKTGYIVPVGDVAALSERFARVLQNPAKTDEMGRRARIVAEERYPYRRMVDDVIALYEDTIRDPRPDQSTSGGRRIRAARANAAHAAA